MFDRIKLIVYGFFILVFIGVAGKLYLINLEKENLISKQMKTIQNLQLENQNLKETLKKIKFTLKAVNFENRILTEKEKLTKELKGNKNEKKIIIDRDINITIP